MAISADTAATLFRAAADYAATRPTDGAWNSKVEHMSQLCASGGSATHIAFLGTAMLAKAVDSGVDLFAIKPRHAGNNENAYSARSLCHSVLVPLSAELGVNIGVNGREPLNNQPYFRMTRLGDGTPVHTNAQPAFDFMLTLVRELQSGTSAAALDALRAFIAVRRHYQTVYTTNEGALAVSAANLAFAIARLVTENSEGGKRAQAAVAGLFDVFASPARVESGRINDPSRHYPGDVAVRGMDGAWEKAVEVRDKFVSEQDIYIFARNCLSRGVREAGVVLAAPSQHRLNDEAIAAWAASVGLGITLFYGWDSFVDQVLFWSDMARTDGVAAAVERIEARLIGVEASPAAVLTWQALTRL
jgi:hypothetical protein